MKWYHLKRALATTAIAALLVTSFGACAESGEPQDGGAPAPQQAADEAAAPDDSGALSDGAKEIKFAHMYTENTGAATYMTDTYQWVALSKEKFEAENPDYTVKLEYIPGGDYPTRLMSDYASGINHDVIQVQTAEIAQSVQVGNLYDIKPFYDAWTDEEKNDFNWNPTWEAYEIDGRLYGIPCGLHTRTIAYRKDLFAEAGLTEPPKTLEEMTEYAKLLTKDDVWGLGIYMGPHQASTEVVMMPTIWSLGGNIYDEATGMATFDDPAVAEVIQWMYNCVYVDQVTPAWTLEGLQDETLLRPFLNGQFAMAFGIGNYWISDLEEAGLLSGAYPATADVDDSKVGWFVIPADTGKTYANSWGIGISADTTDAEAAFRLLECALDPEILEYFISYGGFPGRLSKFEAPEYNSDFWQGWLDVAATGQTLLTPTYNNLKDSLTAAMQEIITSQDDSGIKEVLQRYQDEYNNRYGGR